MLKKDQCGPFVHPVPFRRVCVLCFILFFSRFVRDANVPTQLVHPESSKSSQEGLKIKALIICFGSYLCLGAASDR